MSVEENVDRNNGGTENVLQNKENSSEKVLLENLNTLLNSGKGAQEVVDTIQQLPLVDRSKLEFQIRLARAYVQVGRSKEAEQIFLRCSEEDPTSVEASRLLGSYYVQNQKWPEAERYLGAALELDPTNWKALAGLGKIFLLRDDDKVKARMFLREAVRIESNDENLLFEYAMVLFHFDDHLPARDALREAERVNPQMNHKVCHTVTGFGHIVTGHTVTVLGQTVTDVQCKHIGFGSSRVEEYRS